ncbi:MAG: 2-hydroxyacyl-CoA dehydratase family protein [Proteobacteria bacterium]|nr:2-hydroxyacyl-CoA dehydratase family protein [Pseudomonadota bacterium]
MKSLEKARNMIESRHQRLSEWKEKGGGKVVGEFCKYVPEEMISASGALPVFISGEMDRFQGVDRFLQENTCPYMRSCFSAGIAGDYDYLDALVVTHGCDIMSKMHDFWGKRTKVPEIFLLDFPHKVNEASLVFFREVIERFKQFLESVTGVEITEASLSESIRAYNAFRRTLKAVYDLRRQNPRPVNGTETLTVLLASMLLPIGEADAFLGEFLAEAGSRTDLPPQGVPIMVTGTDVSNLDLFQFLEDSGALIVSDDLCTGSRYFWHPVDENEAPLDALARRYLTNIPCSRTVPSEERYEHIIRVAKVYQAQGVIMPIVDFCDNHMFDAPYVLNRISNSGLPVLPIEVDFTRGGLEQVRPNVETFIEIIAQGE